MSSATSIDGDVRVNTGGTPQASAPAASGRDTFRPWHFFVLISLLAATVGLIVIGPSRPEQLVMISVTIGAAGFAAAALYRTLAPLVAAAPAPSEGPLPESARAGLEREKLLVLRALKELEFDRAMGKVSASDFEDMTGRLRARAMSLMRQLDAGGAYRELIERELQARVGVARVSPRPAAPASAAGAVTASSACRCGTINDPDAAFCKRCGRRLEPSTSS